MHNPTPMPAPTQLRKPWIRPVIEPLSKLSDLTLQSIPGGGGFF